MKYVTTAACLVAGVVAGSLVADRELLFAYLGHARADESASHIVLVPLLTVWLLFQRRRDVFASPRFDLAGVPLVIAGLVARLLSAWYLPATEHASSLAATVATVVMVWWGVFLVCFGRTAFRAGLFPLLFLVFMIPIPPVLLDSAVEVLKRGSAEAVAALFSLTGTPYHRDNFLFALPRITIEIADECSGIRSSIALLLTSLLAGDAFLRGGWSKLLLILAVLPVAILKNGIRIVTLSLLAIHVDDGFLTGQLHHEGGVVFFVVSLVILAPLVAVLRRSEHRFLSPS